MEAEVKITKSDNTPAYVTYLYQHVLEKNTLKISGNIRMVSGNCMIAIRLTNLQKDVLAASSVDISQTDNTYFEVSIDSQTINYDYIRLFITFYGNAEDSLFLDNLNLISQ